MTRPPMRVRGEWKMRGRFLVGAAVVLGAFGVVNLSGEAEAATCNDFRNYALRTQDADDVAEWLARATACPQDVRVEIRAHLDALRGSTPAVTPAVVEAKDDDAPPSAPTGPSVSRQATTRTLTIGQTVNGALSSSSAVDPERGAAFEYWNFQAAAGQRLQVSMAATGDSRLDTYLVVGRMQNGQFEQIAYNDDRGDGTFNSMLRFTPEEAGQYTIRARAFSGQQYGAYSLAVQPSIAREATPRPLRVGAVRNANLSFDSPTDPEGGWAYDVWTFDAEAGQQLQVSMTGQFDTYLVVGYMRNNVFEQIAENDDRRDGTLNSMLRFMAEDTGEYQIRARSFVQEQFGDYQIMVQPTNTPATSPQQFQRNATGWVLPGEIVSESTTAGAAVDFTFQAARGKSYLVRAITTEFTPIIDVGLVDGNRVTEVNFLNPQSDRNWSSAEFTANRAGTYVLRVSAPAGSAGRFDLLVTER